MRKFFKQLFCKHDYFPTAFKQYGFWFDHLRCKKCGKEKILTFEGAELK